jgi:plastocyanin
MRLSPWMRKAGFGLVALCAALTPALLSAPVASAHGAGDSGHRTWYVHVGLENHDHSIQVMTFSPSELWINEGDKVVWVTGSAEIHTVTFTSTGAPPPQPFGPTLQQVTRTSSHVFKTGTFFNSGVLANINPQLGPDTPYYHDYALTFPSDGTFTYYCWVHPMMAGVIHVNEEGARYPHTQGWYNGQTAKLRATSLHAGRELAERAEENANNHLVFAGTGNDMVDYMRFIRQEVTIHVGESVTFTNLSFGPHTVNFGPEVGPPNVAVGNPASFNGSGPLASGFLFHEQSYTVTFTKAGDYNYFCALHDYMGMVGVVHVIGDDD